MALFSLYSRLWLRQRHALCHVFDQPKPVVGSPPSLRMLETDAKQYLDNALQLPRVTHNIAHDLLLLVPLRRFACIFQRREVYPPII